MYIFGGYDDDSIAFTNDLYRIDTSGSCKKITLTGSGDNIPARRYGHSMVVIGDYMYIFGGEASDLGKVNDLYKIDINGIS